MKYLFVVIVFFNLVSCYYPKQELIEVNWFITDFWNLIKEQQPQGGLTIDSRWL
jgi:hypothetical protein